MTIPTDLIDRLRACNILIDSNLLFLWIVGDVDRGYIERSGRTRQYTPADFDILDEVLQNLIRHFNVHIVVTANILTEVSNLANDLKGEFRGRFFDRFAEAFGSLDEIHHPARDIPDRSHFSKFGLTDLITLEVARDRCNVLTDDGRLADYLGRHGVFALTMAILRANA